MTAEERETPIGSTIWRPNETRIERSARAAGGDELWGRAQRDGGNVGRSRRGQREGDGDNENDGGGGNGDGENRRLGAGRRSKRLARKKTKGGRGGGRRASGSLECARLPRSQQKCRRKRVRWRTGEARCGRRWSGVYELMFEHVQYRCNGWGKTGARHPGQATERVGIDMRFLRKARNEEGGSKGGRHCARYRWDAARHRALLEAHDTAPRPFGWRGGACGGNEGS